MDGNALKSLLKIKTISWLGNALTAGALLAICRITESAFWWMVTVIFAVVFAYRHSHTARTFKYMYASLWIVALTSLYAVYEVSTILILSVFFGAMFFVYVGITQLRFKDVGQWLNVFYFLLSCAAFALFAHAGPAEHVLGASIPLLLFLYMTGNEYVSLETGEIPHRRMRVYVLGVSCLATQLAWLSALLSIGYLNTATLILAFFMVGMTLIVHYFNGTYTKYVLIKDVGFFLGFSIIICALAYYAS